MVHFLSMHWFSFFLYSLLYLTEHSFLFVSSINSRVWRDLRKKDPAIEHPTNQEIKKITAQPNAFFVDWKADTINTMNTGKTRWEKEAGNIAVQNLDILALTHTHIQQKCKRCFCWQKRWQFFLVTFITLTVHTCIAGVCVCPSACSDMSNRFFNVAGHGIYRCLDICENVRDCPCVLIPTR